MITLKSLRDIARKDLIGKKFSRNKISKLVFRVDVDNYSPYNRFYLGRWMDCNLHRKDLYNGVDYKHYRSWVMEIPNTKAALRMFNNMRCEDISIGGRHIPNNMKVYRLKKEPCQYQPYPRTVPKDVIMTAYTDDYIYGEVNDGTLREITVLFYDQNKYLYFLYNGEVHSSKAGYVYPDLNMTNISPYKFLLEDECEKFYPELYEKYTIWYDSL